MRRAGWGVWIAYDLPGSYEEMPPNLIDELKRDRRWCQGNLMNFRLFLVQGPASGAPRGVHDRRHGLPLGAAVVPVPDAVDGPARGAHADRAEVLRHAVPAFSALARMASRLGAIALFTATAMLLFLPKLLGVALIARRGAQQFGGVPRLAASTLIEIVFSMLLAPIRMLFHTQFVAGAAARPGKLAWKSPPREDAETSWGEALRRHGVHTVLGIVWAALVYWLNPSFLWWLLPVVGALSVSIPISVLSSRVSLGRRVCARSGSS